MKTSALAGFLVSGFLFALVGALLPSWGYDLSTDFASVGRHFLALAVGMIASATLIRRFVPRFSTRLLLISGCAVATLSLIALAATPAQITWRFTGILVLGIALGLLHSGLFQAIFPAYEQSPATALNLGGIFFGAGSITCALLVSGTFWAYSLPTILLLLAIVPAAFILLYLQRVYPPVPIVSHPEVLKQFRSTAAILFSFLLFFQFGNEWSIAGWLPVFLIHRLGMSPASALEYLAFYFAALTAGRIGISYLLTRVNHWRLLAASAGSSLLGCIVLALTDNRFGAGVSIFLLGLGFAAIYPLVIAWIGRRFPYYHPTYFNGIFSVALAGGMLSPWLLGEIAAISSIRTIMMLPAIGTCMVFLLLCLIWVEAKVTGS